MGTQPTDTLRRFPCTRCETFYDSRAVYAQKDLTSVAGTRARLCHNCTAVLAAIGHIRLCDACGEHHSSGHMAPGCLIITRPPRVPLWSYRAPGSAHGRYAEIWRRAKAARAEEVAGHLEERRHQFGYGNFKTLDEWLRETLSALNRRINLKAGIRADYPGRKALAGTPLRLLGRGRSVVHAARRTRPVERGRLRAPSRRAHPFTISAGRPGTRARSQ